MQESKIRVGVSRCLLGDKVRFDGGHTRNSFVADRLTQWVEYVPVCPEVEIGLGTPRPTIRLSQINSKQELIVTKTGEVLTEKMNRYALEKIETLKKQNLDGFILKKYSPSCGMERLTVYEEKKKLHRKGVGVFAKALMDHWPELPLEEEGRLGDAVLREHFIERLYGRFRFRQMVTAGRSKRRLLDFHTEHKMLLLSHSERLYRELGRLVANKDGLETDALFHAYEVLFNKCLNERSSPKKHANVLQHCLGFFRKFMSAEEKQDLLISISDFKSGLVPLVVPVSLMRFNIKKYGLDYLGRQLYFQPHPKQLALRNYCH